eukprot:gnl/Spiro4/28705_TR14201_c0_g1_i1.p1 gnl/Spiro4/28705_TR14201_c0_g1~~gnl/Spiro4/28705_TR14201_c0_g1_i1.p1  ORF type:complete len:545 (+),score=104.34 gnl/Spiro4/28705_TR14201_c0_g1_i1:91-1725(+)
MQHHILPAVFCGRRDVSNGDFPSSEHTCGAPLKENVEKIPFSGRLLLNGLGSIGLATLPLILRHIEFLREGGAANSISIITGADRAEQAGLVKTRYGISSTIILLTQENYCSVLESFGLEAGDFLLNLSVDVCSCSLIRWCRDHGVLYLDTVVEPWAGVYTDSSLSASQRSNYKMREDALAIRNDNVSLPTLPTAIITHGANPGLVSHFVKRALLNIAKDFNISVSDPKSQCEWAQLAQSVGLQAIHIAERDTQRAATPRTHGEFTNTWSVDGFVGEGCQPAELGWGTHEKSLPADGQRHSFGCGAAIFLNRPGASTRVRSWTPREGPYHGFLITHHEAISIADYLTLKTESSAGSPSVATYRPTVHYAYHPCDDAVLSLHEMAGKNWAVPTRKRVMMQELVDGIDELGVLLMGQLRTSGAENQNQSSAQKSVHCAENGTWAYWHGSQLSLSDARRLADFNSATSLQVAAAALSGLVWAIRNPARGVLEPDDLPHDEILALADPYIQPVVGVYSSWTPLQDRRLLFSEDVDLESPFQFRNVRVV